MKPFAFISHLTIVSLLLFICPSLKADEGMWLLSMLRKYNAGDLYRLGLKISVDEIAGPSDNTLSEAVVAFGSGCTGSVISSQGLVLTNYHCSYAAVQQHNSMSNNLNDNGYWAANQKEELPVAGLKITLTKKIIDISEEVQALLPGKQNVPRQSAETIDKISKKYQQRYPGCRIITRSYRNNTIYVLYVQIDYEDVRLVGVPPRNIAKFGGETDNWMWPRYSPDFAFFRIYSGPEGKPAKYSPINVPLTTPRFLSISTAGYQQGDFAMSIGFPSMSDRYATSYQVYEKRAALNPPLIAVRKYKLTVLGDEMKKNDTVKIAYAEKYSNAANYFKNAIGMNHWIDTLDIIGKKKMEERRWMEWFASNDDISITLRRDFSWLDQTLRENIIPEKALQYYLESFNETCDIINFITAFGAGFKDLEQGLPSNARQRQDYLANVTYYYKRLHVPVDIRLTKGILQLLKDSLPPRYLPDIFEKKGLFAAGRLDSYVDSAFQHSVFSDSTQLKEWLRKPRGTLTEDPLFLLAQSIDAAQRKIAAQVSAVASGNRHIYNRYTAMVNAHNSGKYYPDADRTMRLSYGTVADLKTGTRMLPFQTTLGGLINKEDTNNSDYFVNPLLKILWNKKGFGAYSLTGDLPACFITNGDVTGGNSGSPMLDAQGRLIGLVFDCNWESMTREFNYDPSLFRVICADIRFVLFLTEQLSGNKKLVEEILRPETGNSSKTVHVN